MKANAMTIRALTADDRDAALRVINSAADWYQEIVDSDDVHGVEMTPDAWIAESERMTWYGAFDGETLIGVIGLEYLRDVALLRHWYVDPACQRSGAGSLLRAHLESCVTGVDRIIAGTFAQNYKARGALERAGYRLSPDPQAVLREYYDIPEDRTLASVTLERRLTG